MRSEFEIKYQLSIKTHKSIDCNFFNWHYYQFSLFLCSPCAHHFHQSPTTGAKLTRYTVMASNQLSLARYAFNIYGTLNVERRDTKLSPLNKLIYNCEREVVCLSQLHHPMGRLTAAHGEVLDTAPAHHVVIGGKNYLKLLALNNDQTRVVADVSIVDPQQQTRLHSSSKLFNVNTVKCYGDMVACGLTTGGVSIFQVSSSGKSRLAYKLEDHQRAVNLVDFSDQDQVLFLGSQDGTVKVWDLRTFSPRPVMRLATAQHSDPVRSCEYSRHTRVRGKITVLSVHDSGSLCKYDLRAGGSGNILPERKWTCHTGPALSLHIHPDAEYVLTGGRDRRIGVWAYGETLHSTTPYTVVPTYGPVMKVRWSTTASSYNGSGTSFPPPAAGCGPDTLLSDYDFACLYLNDDPTIAVYNLQRKYVPKEIITTSGHKPMQNFVWAGGNLDRRIWALTKSNVFVLYNLATGDSGLLQIARPLSDLLPVATAWHAHADLAVVAQDSHDYLAVITADDELLDRSDEWERTDHSDTPAKTPVGLLPTQSALLHHKPQSASPKDRPQLVRLSTGFTSTYSGMYAPHASHGLTPVFAKSPSPGPHRVALDTFGLGRPPLAREPSQSTQDSEGGFPVHGQGARRPGGPSPFVVPVAVPIALGDDAVFAVLAAEYHVAPPDGFALADVCQMNARLAASVLRHRDCQVWRLLAVVLDETDLDGDLSHFSAPDDQNVAAPLPADAQSLASDHYVASSTRSVGSSDLGNFGSYTSNSTLTTNYGTPRHATGRDPLARSASTSSFLRVPRLGRGDDHALVDDDSLLPRRGISMNSSRAEIEPSLLSVRSIRSVRSVVDESDQSALDDSDRSGADIRSEPSATDVRSDRSAAIDIQPLQSVFSVSDSDDPVLRRTSRTHPWQVPSDLDNENLGILTAAASYLSGFLSQSSTSRRMLKGSPSNLRGSFARTRLAYLEHLERVDESVRNDHTSELTRAIRSHTSEDELVLPELHVPWNIISMLKRAIEYAMDQGDIVMCSTLILLFHSRLGRRFSHVLANNACLECLGLYVETLRRKQLFTTAIKVVKEAPPNLKYKLGVYASKDVSMRFYCCWCNRLMVNEASKARFGPDSDTFGYWYCDECHRRQLNCIYCNEPCRGLTVVVNLKCGHRGHFGCLQEWFVLDGNSECPAGCQC